MNAEQLCIDVTRVFGAGAAFGLGVGMIIGALWDHLLRIRPLRSPPGKRKDNDT